MYQIDALEKKISKMLKDYKIWKISEKSQSQIFQLNLTILEALKSVLNQPGSIHFQPWLSGVEYTYLYDKPYLVFVPFGIFEYSTMLSYREIDWESDSLAHFSDLFHIHFI